MGKKDYDPAMHTAEHILNQTMDRLFACGRSFNAHIEKKKSKCDYRFSRPLTAEEISAVETAVNRVIGQNLAVSERMVDRAEYKRRQSPPGIKITERAFGRDRRMPITRA